MWSDMNFACIDNNIHYLFFIFRDDGPCKHCVALLFSLSSYSDRHRDRFTETCIDQEFQWDKPKKTSVPMEIDDIDNTQGEIKNEEWFLHRRGRITGSLFS